MKLICLPTCYVVLWILDCHCAIINFLPWPPVQMKLNQYWSTVSNIYAQVYFFLHHFLVVSVWQSQATSVLSLCLQCSSNLCHVLSPHGHAHWSVALPAMCTKMQNECFCVCTTLIGLILSLQLNAFKICHSFYTVQVLLENMNFDTEKLFVFHFIDWSFQDCSHYC